MMTLDEAIQHCKDREDCTECGKEHRQLREWLEELKVLRGEIKHGDLIEKEPLMKFISDGINNTEYGEHGYGYVGVEILAEVEYADIIIPSNKGD